MNLSKGRKMAKGVNRRRFDRMPIIPPRPETYPVNCLEEYGVEIRVLNELEKRLNVYNLRQLLMTTPETLRATRYIGEKSARSIIEAVKLHRLHNGW